MKGLLVRAFLYTCRFLGLFSLARALTKERVRILCYHGFEIEDEHLFRPKLFMSAEVFERRLDYLRRRGFPVITLQEAVAQLGRKNPTSWATVLTIDDGFYSVYAKALPLLEAHEAPATLYLTTYYFQKQTPIFRILVHYIIWKAKEGKAVDISEIGVPEISNSTSVALSQREKECIYNRIREYGETQCDEPTRQNIATQLAAALNVDYDQIFDSRILSLINESEARDLECSKIDLQLHSHRHEFPKSSDLAKKEIIENRRALESVVGEKKVHFSYPSGEWSPAHFSILEEMKIQSAVTCDRRLARRGDHKYALPRLLDDMLVSQIEFEAEVTGFMDLIRDLRGKNTQFVPD